MFQYKCITCDKLAETANERPQDAKVICEDCFMELTGEGDVFYHGRNGTLVMESDGEYSLHKSSRPN